MSTRTRQTIDGMELPGVTLAEMVGDQVHPVPLRNIFGFGRHLLVGLPGAFTPVCDGEHVPELLRNASELKRSGLRSLNCIVTSSPFAVRAWAEVIDPAGVLNFYSDGNLDLARALDLVSQERGMFLGERSCRYLLVIDNGVIVRSRVECSALDFQCTRSDDLLIDA